MSKDTSKEIWKDILGYEGFYKISNLGRVKSLKRKVPHLIIGEKTINEKILKPASIKTGHLNVVLSVNGIHKHKSVHRLVAIAFIPNPNNFPMVNHKDENPSNNCVDNLEWCTAQYNNTYGTFAARRIKHTDFLKRSLTAKKYVIPVIQMNMLGETIKVWKSMTEASKETGALISKISNCCKGLRKSTNGSMWKYREMI